MRIPRPPITVTLLIALTLVTFAPAPAQADALTTAGDDATVTLTVDAPESLYYDFEPFHWQDEVAYEDGMTALDLLTQVVDARESTMAVTWADLDGDGTADDAFVDEINGVATDFSLVFVGRYWGLHNNGEPTPTGAAKTVLHAGDEVRFVYEGFPVTF